MLGGKGGKFILNNTLPYVSLPVELAYPQLQPQGVEAVQPPWPLLSASSEKLETVLVDEQLNLRTNKPVHFIYNIYQHIYLELSPSTKSRPLNFFSLLSASDEHMAPLPDNAQGCECSRITLASRFMTFSHYRSALPFDMSPAR